MRKQTRLMLVSSLIILLTHIMFVAIPVGHAQSIQNWSDPINLSRSGTASNPSMVVDSNGVLHVVWVDKFEGIKHAESPDGKTWSPPTTVKFPFSTQQAVPPVFLADANGIIHVFWLSEKNILRYSQTSNENFDLISAWKSTTTLDTTVYDFDVAMDANGSLHVGYVKNPVPTANIAAGAPAGTAGVFYRRSGEGGVKWFASIPLYESFYFRSLTPENTRVRIAVSDSSDEEQVYVVWDDQPEKRIFMAKSNDGGLNWNPSKELITPQASLGFKIPYHADIDVLKDQLLVTWQVGDPGVQCTPYSFVSSDRGESWDEPIKILGEFVGCPEKSDFIPIDPAYSTNLFIFQNDLSLSAWNGNQWSNPETQVGPSSVNNPVTFDTVVLGCQQAKAHKNQLFVVGCDQGSGGDIWFMMRQLETLGNYFPEPSAWGRDTNVTTTTQTITSLSSITDAENNVHALWVRSSSSSTNPAKPQIEYSRWSPNKWTNPTPIMTDLSGLPINLTLQIDSHQRLFLSWINQQTGELLFSWADAERANIPLEWITPVILSTSSPLSNSPDILVDASNRILITYANTLNEGRGIYIIQSTDLGETWSSPVRVFDAAAANWEMVDQPKLAVTEDGKLHIIFTQYTLLGSQKTVGLYSSESADGGVTWTPPEVIIKKPVEWSEVVAYGRTIHRFWRERDQSVISTYHQVSPDSGITWSQPTSLPRAGSVVSEPAISLDRSGKVLLLQIIQEDAQALQEWEWSDERPQLVESRKLGIPKADSSIVLESGITSEGILYALIQSQYKKLLSIDEIETSILNINRSSELTGEAHPFLASVSTPPTFSLPALTPEIPLAPTQTSILPNMDNTWSSIIRNGLGIFLIVSLVIFVLIFTLPKRSKVTTQSRKSK